jgi:peptidoglycan/xylan/chitin deacetylase (PgdA/CDA1 family)
MNSAPCFTVDVEDFYEGMRALGHDLGPPADSASGLSWLLRCLEGRAARITLFVVGRHADRWRDDLCALVQAGHEVASHGPDHGRLPAGGQELDDWLRSGREMVEDAIATPVRGFRSPRFDIPTDLEVPAFREALAEAGFAYVSDTLHGDGHGAVAELPVATLWRFPFGGGSYQRLLPRRAVAELVRREPAPCVLYYHSYDFGRELPPLRAVRSPAVLSQVLGRGRIAPVFERLIDDLGSRTCTEALDAVR